MGEHHARMHGHHMRQEMGGSKGARFRVEQGEAKIAVKCDDDEPMRACVEATIMLLDKLGSLRR